MLRVFQFVLLYGSFLNKLFMYMWFLSCTCSAKTVLLSWVHENGDRQFERGIWPSCWKACVILYLSSVSYWSDSEWSWASNIEDADDEYRYHRQLWPLSNLAELKDKLNEMVPLIQLEGCQKELNVALSKYLMLLEKYFNPDIAKTMYVLSIVIIRKARIA